MDYTHTSKSKHFDPSALGRNLPNYAEATTDSEANALARNLEHTAKTPNTDVTSFYAHPGLYYATSKTDQRIGKQVGRNNNRLPKKPKPACHHQGRAHTYTHKARKDIVYTTLTRRGPNGNKKQYQRKLYSNYEEYEQATGGSSEAYKKALAVIKRKQKRRPKRSEEANRKSANPKQANMTIQQHHRNLYNQHKTTILTEHKRQTTQAKTITSNTNITQLSTFFPSVTTSGEVSWVPGDFRGVCLCLG